MIYLDLLLLCLIIVCIIDLSGAVQSLKAVMGRRLKADPEHIRIKPLDCSKCMTFWVGSIYSLAVGQLTLGLLLYILTLALLTSFFASVGGLVLLKLENFIQRWEN